MERQGTPWTEQEHMDLQHELKLKMNFDDIAKKHQRSSLAIRLRFARLIQDYIKNGDSKTKIAKMFNTTESMLDKIISENNNSRNNNESSHLLETKVENLEKKIEKLEIFTSKLYEKYKKLSKMKK